jgi:hypothetical protein
MSDEAGRRVVTDLWKSESTPAENAPAPPHEAWENWCARAGLILLSRLYVKIFALREFLRTIRARYLGA